jgi:peroxiredoxin Q/BCP
MISIGDKLPAFKLPANGGAVFSNKDFAGKPLVLYFYPKDSTPGCTIEAQDFRDRVKQFQKIGAAVVGVSRDSIKSHDNFCAKQGLTFPLLADEDEELCNAFGVIKDKSLYGRKFRGIERSTFLFDAKGKLRRDWRGVKVAGHADEVLKAATEL